MAYQNVPSSNSPSFVEPGIDGDFEDKRALAWKYFGYPELSRWMAASRDAFILRRFSAISARSLLYFQHEIAKREKRLNDLDKQSMEEPPDKGGCDSFADDIGTERGQLMLELPDLLNRYYSLVNSFTQNWITNYPNAIHRDERHLFDLEQRGDMFPIIARPKVPLRRMLERSRLLRWLFKLRERPDRMSDLGAIYFSDTGLDNLANILAIVMGLGLLFGPMWWLHWVKDDLPRLGIITVAILLFAAWLWIAGASRSFEILGGTAAYAAVLMVYMQISN